MIAPFAYEQPLERGEAGMQRCDGGREALKSCQTVHLIVNYLKILNPDLCTKAQNHHLRQVLTWYLLAIFIHHRAHLNRVDSELSSHPPQSSINKIGFGPS